MAEGDTEEGRGGQPERAGRGGKAEPRQNGRPLGPQVVNIVNKGEEVLGTAIKQPVHGFFDLFRKKSLPNPEFTQERLDADVAQINENAANNIPDPYKNIEDQPQFAGREPSPANLEKLAAGFRGNGAGVTLQVADVTTNNPLTGDMRGATINPTQHPLFVKNFTKGPDGRTHHR